MIEELTWDTSLFKKKIGILVPNTGSTAEIESELELAHEAEYKYITCKLNTQDTYIIRNLEFAGFYLTDIGVTWAVETEEFFRKFNDEKLISANAAVTACNEDIPTLKTLITSFFLDSRFYNDPFFSKEEADKLHTVWIENSVKGVAADKVLYIPDVGFITCKISPDKKGSIALIGVKNSYRGKGFGKALIFSSMKWFVSQNLTIVNVKTQLRNIAAMNFYRKQGFFIQGYEMTFGKVL